MPASGATGVATSSAVSATFSEALNAATVSGTTFSLVPSGGSAVAATVTYSSGSLTATLTPSAALATSTTYTATLKSGASGIKDVAGNALLADKVWTFTTAAAADTTPPTVTTTVPASGATGVATSSAVSATFSEALNAATVSGTTFSLVPSGGSAVAATVTYSSGSLTATLTPSAALATSTTYTATLKSGASGIKDVAGNALLADKVWTFTTAAAADTTPPTVTTTVPASGATGVATSSAVSATFSEALNAATVSGTTFSLVPSGGSAVAATVTYSSGSLTATLTPSAALATSTTYTATLKSGASGIKDVAGNALLADKVWTFTTAAATGGTTSYLSDLAYTTTANGWGPVEKDRSNGEAGSGDGLPITLNGVVYSKGLGAHAASDIRYAMGGTCNTFSVSVGLDDEVASLGSLVFTILADGTQLWTSGVMTGTSATQTATVSVTGKSQLQLTLGINGDADYDHGDWADAKLTCSP